MNLKSGTLRGLCLYARIKLEEETKINQCQIFREPSINSFFTLTCNYQLVRSSVYFRNICCKNVKCSNNGSCQFSTTTGLQVTIFYSGENASCVTYYYKNIAEKVGLDKVILFLRVVKNIIWPTVVDKSILVFIGLISGVILKS